jgi:hypothetical protein
VIRDKGLDLAFGGLASFEGFLLFGYYWADGVEPGCGVSGDSCEGCVFEVEGWPAVSLGDAGVFLLPDPVEVIV